MPTYLSPGVYVEEVASGSKPIEGVGTAVAAFVGMAPKGPANQPTLVTTKPTASRPTRAYRRIRMAQSVAPWARAGVENRPLADSR